MGEQITLFADMIAEKATSQPDFNVLTFVSVDDNNNLVDERRTYRQLWDQGQSLATALDALGLGEGQSFSLLMQNHPEFVDAMVASSILGSVFVPIDPRTIGAKLSYMINFSDSQGVVCADYCVEPLLNVLADCPALKWVVVVSSGVLTELPKSPVRLFWLEEVTGNGCVEQRGIIPLRVKDPDQPMQLMFTSGTTGDPKAIMGTYRRYHEVASVGPAIGITQDDRPYTGLSLTHANAQFITMGMGLKMGLSTVISRKFTKSKLWDICRHYQCTFFNLLGGMTTAVYSDPVKGNDSDNPVRFVISAGMPAAIWDHFKMRFNVDIYEIYGAAEGGLTLNPPGVGPMGSIGKAPESSIAKVLDENDAECPPFVPGELCFKNADSSVAPVNYYKNIEASSDKTRDGWLRMGDICHTDEQGWLFFDYRKGGGIRKNGDFINPAFVEKTIAEFDGVDDVFVYGKSMQNSTPGEKTVVAAIVITDKAQVDFVSLLAHCKKYLEKNSIPEFFQMLEEIPKTASEKPQERFCLELFNTDKEGVFNTATLAEN
jgi:carnitine-CoA ligase